MSDTTKDDDNYETLEEHGEAQASQTAQNRSNTASSQDYENIDHDPSKYEERTRDELRLLAKEQDIKGRGSMNKQELINALRAL